eukprot:gene19925-21877_t
MAAEAGRGIVIHFDHFIEGHELQHVLKEGIKHMIFHRRQIPRPLMLLEREMRANESRPKALFGENLRKKAATMNSIKSILFELDRFILNNSVHKILLLFGSTIVSPKEVYFFLPYFTFQQQRSRDDCLLHEKENIAPLDSKEKRIDKSARMVLQKLITDEYLADMDGMPLTNLFLLVLASKEADVGVPAYFLPKHSFKVPSRMKKKTYQILLTNENFYSMEGAERYTEQDSNDLIWYQAKETVKGFS